MERTGTDFPHNLKRLRKAAGLTRAALAQQIAYSPKSVEKWEAGQSTPPLAVICRLGVLLHASLDELLLPQERSVCYYLGIDGGG
ncbi:MAG: helix-turn-helix transcriptional regulator, partial [Clostridia bacterium]|nr:helix-turn-helix transcriptional regulator [Clostridia bacterium]